MATRVIDDSKLNDIAVAIQEKDSGGQMTVDDMPDRIDALPTGGTLIPKTITENGVYNAADDNADGYDVVTVDVPEENTLDEYFANTLEVANIPSATTLSARFFSNRPSLINVIMPNVITISPYCFQNCTNLALTKLPSGITNIGSQAFQGCTNLALTELPGGITILETRVFQRCKLTLTKLPSGITYIGAFALADNPAIPYLDFSEFTQIPTVNSDSFNNTTFPFYFRDQQQLDEWAAATNWSTYADRFQIKPSGVI
jgi:hypothetical protein